MRKITGKIQRTLRKVTKIKAQGLKRGKQGNKRIKTQLNAKLKRSQERKSMKNERNKCETSKLEK